MRCPPLCRDGLAGCSRPVRGTEVSVMAGAPSPKRRPAPCQRSFDFSRLQEEWMAAAYALVVPGRGNAQPQPTLSAAGQADRRSRQARHQQTERSAG